MAARATTATTLPVCGSPVVALYANATMSTSQASPSTAAATRSGSQRLSDRENKDMAAVSHALVEFANSDRQPAAPGIEVVATPRYQVTVQPDFPIAGPNSVAWVRCRGEEAEEVIREARAIIAGRGLPVYWILDPGTEPADFTDHLARHGVALDSAVAAMVLPLHADLRGPRAAEVPRSRNLPREGRSPSRDGACGRGRGADGLGWRDVGADPGPAWVSDRRLAPVLLRHERGLSHLPSLWGGRRRSRRVGASAV